MRGRGGGGVKCKFTLTRSGRVVLAMLKRGGTTCFGVVLIRELESLDILNGRRKMFQPFSRAGNKLYSVLKGGCTRFRSCSFLIL